MGQCQASCQGGCNANANISCSGYLHCQAMANVDCEAMLSGGCSAHCSGGGVLVCNGQVVDFESTLDAAKNWIEEHGYASGSAEASCSGNTCEADAEGSAGVKCSTVPGGAGTGSLLAMGLVGLVFGASQLRRKRGS